MSSYAVTVPTTTNGSLSLSSPNSATMSPPRSDDTAAGTYTFEKPGQGAPQVTVTATPASGYAIASWSMAGYSGTAGDVLSSDPTNASGSTTVSSATTVPAPTFAQYHAVTINTVGSGTVSVAVADSASAVSGSTVTVYVRSGTTLSITKTPGSGYHYDSTSGSTTITSASNITVTFIADDTDADAILDAGVGSDDYVGHDTTNKHLLLKVPDYELQGNTASRVDQAASWNPATSEKNAYVQIGDGTDVSGISTTNATLGTDLLAGLYEFYDDIRQRKSGSSIGGTHSGALATPPSETATRVSTTAYSAVGASNQGTSDTDKNAQVSHSIPDYVGWRDHTDGHRITTTRGDKIEVIGGNYKIVSLGRGTGISSYEMSGGIIIDAMEPPGNVSSVTWRECPTEDDGQGGTGFGWRIVSQVVKGNEIDRYHGTKREETYGNELVSVTGSPDETTSANDALETSEEGLEIYVGQSTGVTSAKSLSTSSMDNFSTKAYPTKWDERAGIAPKLQKPDIYESTWAKSVTEYAVIDDDHKEYKKIKGKHREELHLEGGHEAHHYMDGLGDKFEDHFHFGGSMGHFEFFYGAKTEFFFGATTTMGFANRFEFFLGTEEQINFGLMFSFSLGAKIDIDLGGKIDLHFPTKWELDNAKLEAYLSKQKVGVSDNDAKVSKNGVSVSEKKASVSDDQASLSLSRLSLSTKL